MDGSKSSYKGVEKGLCKGLIITKGTVADSNNGSFEKPP